MIADILWPQIAGFVKARRVCFIRPIQPLIPLGNASVFGGGRLAEAAGRALSAKAPHQTEGVTYQSLFQFRLRRAT